MSAVIDKSAPRSNHPNGVSMSEWSNRQEEMMGMIRGLNDTLGTAVFRDRDIEAVTAGCCSCASGQSSAINFCKHER